jgi:hypothetical protein
MRRLKRPTVLSAPILVALVAAGCGTTKIVTVAQPAASKATATSREPARRELAIGGTATLKGEQSGERLEASLLAYKETISAGEYDTPQAGMKFVGVTLRLKNVGTVPYSDSPSNGATILTATGHQGKTAIIASGECSEGFASSVKIAPGESQEGCIPFELPQEDTATKLQWTPSSGFGEETAEWAISSGAASQATRQQTQSSSTPAQESTSSSSPNGALDALNAYWADIGAHNFGGAYRYLMPGSTGLTESQFASSEEQANIENVQFHGRVASSSGSTATIEVASLVTHDQQYGCRTWTGSYDMTDQGSGWLIERANLSPRSCAG